MRGAAHSAISHDISQSECLFVPSQLSTILNVAKREQPHKLHQMESNDFFYLNFLAKDLGILTVRQNNKANIPINWPFLVDWEFKKKKPKKNFY